jgi:hypothetical protein
MPSANKQLLCCKKATSSVASPPVGLFVQSACQSPSECLAVLKGYLSLHMTSVAGYISKLWPAMMRTPVLSESHPLHIVGAHPDYRRISR